MVCEYIFSDAGLDLIDDLLDLPAESSAAAVLDPDNVLRGTLTESHNFSRLFVGLHSAYYFNYNIGSGKHQYRSK